MSAELSPENFGHVVLDCPKQIVQDSFFLKSPSSCQQVLRHEITKQKRQLLGNMG